MAQPSLKKKEEETVHVQQGPQPQQQVREQDPQVGIDQANFEVSSASRVAREIEREMIPNPPSYPQEEAYLYESHAEQPQFKFTESDYQDLRRNVSALPLDLLHTSMFPNLNPNDSGRIDAYTGEDAPRLAAISHATDGKIQKLMAARPDIMKPIDSFTLADGTTVLMGRPLKFEERKGMEGLERYVGIPMYVKKGDASQFVMAYRSGSQGCWRRYAGADYGIEDDVLVGPHYYKGSQPETGKEDWQNFDHRTQRRLDRLYGSVEPLPTVVNVTAFGIRGYGGNEKLVVANEEAVQFSMANGSRQLDISEQGNAPSVTGIVSHWGAKGNRLYGDQINATVESENHQFRYGVTLTKYGVFVQYAEDNTSRDVNMMGAPAVGVNLAKGSEWLLTPVVEYDSQTNIGKPGVKFEERADLPEGRVAFTNLHTEGSPFKMFSQANRRLAGVYAALGSGNLERAQNLFNEWLALPPEQRVQY